MTYKSSASTVLPHLSDAVIDPYVEAAAERHAKMLAMKKAARELQIDESYKEVLQKDKKALKRKLSAKYLHEFEPQRAQFKVGFSRTIKKDWDKFVECYAQQGENSLNVMASHLLYEAAFGKGIKKILEEKNIHSVNDPALKVLKDSLEHITLCNAKGTLSAKGRPLNNLLTMAFIRQWVALLEKPEFDLYPPVKIKYVPRAVLKAVRQRQENALSAMEGGILADLLYCLCSSVLRQEALAVTNKTNLTKNFPEISEDEILSEVPDLFKKSLFSYDPAKGVLLTTYQTGYIRQFLVAEMYKMNAKQKERLPLKGKSLGNFEHYAVREEDPPLIQPGLLDIAIREALSPQVQESVIQVYGLAKEKPKTHKEIAKIEGKAREAIGQRLKRARKILKPAIEKLQHEFEIAVENGEAEAFWQKHVRKGPVRDSSEEQPDRNDRAVG